MVVEVGGGFDDGAGETPLMRPSMPSLQDGAAFCLALSPGFTRAIFLLAPYGQQRPANNEASL